MRLAEYMNCVVKYYINHHGHKVGSRKLRFVWQGDSTSFKNSTSFYQWGQKLFGLLSLEEEKFTVPKELHLSVPVPWKNVRNRKNTARA